ncbi:MAG: hypothetical protein Q7U54_16745 [Bacteroidales bacterium]|nr:hypothetical protein [Bacteroidales bacterium]
MAKDIVNRKNPRVVTPTAKKVNTLQESKDLLTQMNAYLDKRLSWLIWVILGITFFFSLLLFDSRVSLSGDDSFYIIRASDFIHSFKYPAFQGPLYPMVLSIFVAVFGISLVPLKVLSLIFVIGFMYLFFIAFRSRIPSSLLVITLLVLSINSFILYYASQTYNEAFYLFMQIVLVLVFFRGFIDKEKEVSFKQNMQRHLILAISLLALALTKNAGYSAVLAVLAYFILRGQWKNLLYSIAAFGVVMIVFQGVKYLLWSDGGLQFSTQGSSLMNKDYYNPQAGKEDFGGFVTRLIDNSNLYLSKHFMSMIGFRKIVPGMSVSSIVSVFIYILSIGSLVITFKKNKYLFFTGLLAGAFLLISFLILQTKWDQNRLIIPAIPLLILMIFSFIYYVSCIKEYKLLQVAVPLLAILIFFQSIAVTAGAIKGNQKISGKYGGLSPDWKNYLKASEWAAMNLPKDAIVACRKPSISFVYGKGRSFYGIMQLPAYSTDVFVNNWAKNDSAYMLFNYADFSGKQLNPQLFSMLKENMVAMLFVGDTVFFADKIEAGNRSSFYKEVNSAGFNYISSAGVLKPLLNQGKLVKLYYPDSLINQLQNAGVTHILTANLRRNSTQKDGMIINTVERYMAFIQEKYPQIFSKVSQIGDDDNEPATIVKIEYEKYGFKVKEPITK